MPSPRVLAVVVAHDGAAWLPDTLDALAAQTHEALEIVAVDNGSVDGSRELLRHRLGDDHVLVSDVDLGFPGAVSMALDARVAADSPAPWLLFVHDDLLLAPDAVERLVARAAADPRLAAVGPKLLQRDEPGLLQQVGMTIDLTGRTDSGLEADEVDHGQRDRPRPVLYVSTAGMLVRREAFDAVGRFDPRFHVFRDDLDLCWRLWLSGRDVEVAPDATGYHVRAVANYRRLGGTRTPGPRYYAERHTLATLMKNYGALRLAIVLPLFFIVGLAKVLGFVATRRFGDAVQTVRAWAWNVRQLPATLRLRSAAQAGRARADTELRPLFVRIVPRLRAYGEAMGDWLAGGPGDVPVPGEEAEEQLAPGRGPRRYIARRPVLAVAAVLALAVLVGAFRLLLGGTVRGGDFAPWPDSPLAFLSTYASAWNDAGGLGTATPASPAQAVLGLLHVAAFGNEWLASRIVLLGALPTAWILAMRAGVLLTRARLPRLLGSTAYVLSPPVLAALTRGDLGALVVAVLLPLLVLCAGSLARTDASKTAAWRFTAGAAIVGAVMTAFTPVTGLVLLAAALAGVAAVALASAPPEQRRAAAARIATAAVGAFLLLLPWSLTFVGPDSPLLAGGTGSGAVDSSFLAWLALAPDLSGFPGLVVGVAFPAAGLVALFVAYERRPVVVGGLWTAVVTAVFAGWLLGRPVVAVDVWPGLALLVAALGYAALLTAGAAEVGRFLTEHAFGWRQVGTIGTGAAVLVGLLAGIAWLAGGAWEGYRVDDPVLPAFVTAEQEVDGPYRVLVMSDEDGVVQWDVTGPDGPTMAAFGAPVAVDAVAIVGEAVEDMVASVSPAAAGRLGLANILYVYVPEGGRGEALENALSEQLDLEPQSVEHGLVYRVGRWSPRAAHVSPRTALAESRKGELPPEATPTPLRHVADDRFRASDVEAGSVLLAEPAHPGWVAQADGSELPRRTSYGLLRFRLRDSADNLTLEFSLQGARTAAVVFQAGLVLLAISLVLRPPRFAGEERA